MARLVRCLVSKEASMKSSRIARVAATVSVTCLLVGAGAVSAQASEPNTAAAAEAVFVEVLEAPDQAAELQSLSPQERELFDLWTTPVVSEITTTFTPDKATGKSSIAAAAAACGSWRQNGSFSNQVGAKLGDFWTTGQGCRSGSSVTSVSYLDGGGRTSGIGWGYTGKTTAKGVVRNVGYVYGQYNFKLNIAGVDVQKPSYCARAIFTTAVSRGDLACGLG